MIDDIVERLLWAGSAAGLLHALSHLIFAGPYERGPLMCTLFQLTLASFKSEQAEA